MIQSDILSWLKNLDLEESDNEDKTLLPENLFIQSIDLTLRDRISSITEQDNVVTEVFRAIANGGTLPMKSQRSDWKKNDNLILFKDRVYVPPNLAL